MRVALCYWGLARSTDITIESIEACILEPLKQANIQYTVFLHTFLIFREYNNCRANEWDIEIKNDIWKLLLPNYYIVDNQDEVDKDLELSSYRTKGDPWKHEGNPYIEYNTLNNHIRSLYSLYKVTSLWKSKSHMFDVVIYLRPDVRYIKPISIEWLKTCMRQKDTIYIPDFQLHNEWNDRFAIGSPETMVVYGERYLYAQEYSKTNKLHSEEYLSNYMKKCKKHPTYIQFPFRRIRADGSICPADEQIL